MPNEAMKFSLVCKAIETSFCHLAMEGKFLTCIIIHMLLFNTKNAY